MARLDHQVAIITGASSGIGAATARLFGREGAAVVVAHHDHPDEAAKVVADIEKAGGRALAIGGDARDEAYVEQLFTTATKAFGRPTLLVNSAGVDASGIAVGEMKVSQFRDVLETNLVAPFLFCGAFVRAAQGAPGRILNVTSVHEDIPRAGAADYCASKGGLRNLTRCMALELAEKQITINNIAPGMILTPMNQEAIDDPEKRKEQTASIPVKRAAEPEEVAELALYLASAKSNYATGATFTLDGGLSMNLGQGA